MKMNTSNTDSEPCFRPESRSTLLFKWLGHLLTVGARKQAIVFVIMIAVTSLAVFIPTGKVHAQAGTAADLLAAVNAYRTSNGLQAYQIDSTLMKTAQSQSDYQASIRTCTHQRADGSGPGDHGISAENVACGINLSVDGAIYGQWTDSVHSATILGPDTGLAGAGVAVSNGSVYYTLDVKLLTGSFAYRPPKSSSDLSLAAAAEGTATPNAQSQLASPVITSTPNSDGSIAHVIQYGETLVQIVQAYGITLNDLYANNPALDPTNPVYYAGQTLIIRPAFTPTPELSPTNTPLPPTRTPRPTRTATEIKTAAPLQTITQVTITPTQAPGISGPDNRTIGFGLIVISAVGLIAVLIVGFIRQK